MAGTVQANVANAQVTNSSGGVTFNVSTSGEVITGSAGDNFVIQDGYINYNTYNETSGGTMLAGANNALLGFVPSFSAATGITTLSANGYTGVQAGSAGAVLNTTGIALNGVGISLAQNGQTVTVPQSGLNYTVSTYNDTINAGGSDTFMVVDPYINYNSYNDVAGGTLQAGTNNALLGFSNSLTAADGITTLSANGHTGVMAASNGALLNTTGITLNGVGISLAQTGQTVIAPQSGLNYAVSNYNDIINGGGHDTFTVVDSYNNSNTYNDIAGGTLQAGTNNALLGFGNSLTTADGISTLSGNGYSGVMVASQGAVLNLTGIAISDVGISAQQSNQVITAPQSGLNYKVTNTGDTFNGGGNDIFTVDDVYNYANTYNDGSGGTIQAGMNGAVIGLAGNFGAGNGIGTISGNGYSGVVIQGRTAGATLDFSQTNVSDATIRGGANNVTIVGPSGNQTLTGGGQSDVFAFTAGTGNDVITDFRAGSGGGYDVINLNDALAAPNFATLLTQIQQVGANVVISLNNGGSITLDNVNVSSLKANNFNLGNEAEGLSAANGAVTVGHGQSINLTSAIDGLITQGALDGVTTATTITGLSSTKGIASLASGGVADYTAPASGSDTVSYTATDQFGDVVSGQIAVTVDVGPSVAGTPRSINLSTGQNASGVVQQTTDSLDANWQITGAAAPLDAPNAYVVGSNALDFGYGGWMWNNAASSWIAAAPDNPHGNGDMTATDSFTLTASDIAHISSAGGGFAADDSGAIYINGHELTSAVNAWGSWTSFTIPTADLVVGTNTLSLVTYNADFELEGLRVDASIQIGTSGYLTIGHGQSQDVTSLINGQITPGAQGDTETVTSNSGDLVKNAQGHWIYTAPNGQASDTPTFTVTDQLGNTTTGSIAVTIDQGPVAANTSIVVGHNQNTYLTTLINGLVTPGLAGDTETITAVSGAHSFLGGGNVIYGSPSTGSGSFTYTVTDQLGETATGQIAVTIDAGPTVANGTLTLGLGQSQDVTGLINGLITKGLVDDTETITATNGNLVKNAQGAWIYTAPISGMTDSITFRVTDQVGDVASGTVAVTLPAPAPPPPPPVAIVTSNVVNLWGYDNAVVEPVTVAAPSLLAGNSVTGPVFGNAIIIGTPNNITITAQGYNNTIIAGGGNDTINAGLSGAVVTVSNGTGNNLVQGSIGMSSVVLSNGNNIINLGGYNNAVQLGSGDNSIDTGVGVAKVVVGNGDNTITAGGYSNSITAGSGDNTINAGAGYATVQIGTGSNTITAGGSNDVIRVAGANAAPGTALSTGINNLVLGGTNDTVTLGSADNSVTGSQGYLTLTTGNGSQTISAGGYDNVITVGVGSTNTGSSTIDAGVGNATVSVAGSGNNIVSAAGNNNTITAGDGNNTINAGNGMSQVTVGNGTNSITAAGYSNHIIAGNGQNVIDAGQGYDTISVGSGNNTINVEGYNNHITVVGGTSAINAGQGIATVDVGASSANVTLGGYQNLVIGGASHVVVSGGADNTYQLNGFGDGDGMTINNFSANNGDVLDLSNVMSHTDWNHEASTLSSYLNVTAQGNDTLISINSSGAGGQFVTAATLQNMGPTTLDSLRGHHALNLF